MQAYYTKKEVIEIHKDYPKIASILFVCKAISKDETRFALNHIKVEEERIIATDGRRLHIADIECDFDFLEPGHYLVEKINKKSVTLLRNNDEDIKYPNWEQVIPEGFKNKESVEAGDSFVSQVALATGAKFCTNYLEDINSAIGFGSLNVHFNDKFETIKIEDGTRTAIIMPMRG